MLLYRVFPYLEGAREDQPGHPQYLHRPQGSGRLDNPGEYDCWYLAGEASGAVGETFGDLVLWTPSMFSFPYIGAQRALGTYRVDDATPILDLDDPRVLLDRHLRPTQVVSRQRTVTQQWALSIFLEEHNDKRAWSGVRWWSYHRPQWQILGLWSVVPECVEVEPLTLRHPAVVDAAAALSKQVQRGR
jgi:hypothetical protein